MSLEARVERGLAAAGTVPWRRRKGRLQVALVHRPRYDDWSWAKGKLDPGEQWPVTALRETDEETSMRVALGLPLPAAHYEVAVRRPAGPARTGTKEVRYWAARVVEAREGLQHEVDAVEWLEPAEAAERLDHGRDHDQLDALVAADSRGELDTWPLLVVRHAEAVPRSAWSQDDRLRPLDAAGASRALAVADLLRAYDVRRVLSSPAVRCMDTVRPYAREVGLPIKEKEGLSEEGFEARRDKVHRHIAATLAKGRPTALCTHRPVLPDLLAGLSDHAAEGSAAEAHLLEAAAAGIDKGAVVVCHVVGTGQAARVVATERW